MDFNFMQGTEKQKISELEKNLQILKETLKATSVAFGNKLLNESENFETKELIRDELIDNWTCDVENRKKNTDIILKIKSTIEREQHLKNLLKETQNLIVSKEKNISKSRADFAILAYKNHREEFAETIGRIPEVSQLEAEIEEEKSKIDSRIAENTQKGLFEKFIPAVKNLLSQGKVSSTESKLKKLVREKSGDIFSDDDFDYLFEIIDEVPQDLSAIVSDLKEAKSVKISATAKLKEIKQELGSIEGIFAELGVSKNSRGRISELMQEIKILDEQIENTALLASNICVDNFFDAEGNPTSESTSGNIYAKQIANIADLRKKCFVADINIELAKHENEVKELEKKIQNNLDKIAKNQKQIQNLNDEITTAEDQNSDMNLSIQDLQKEMESLRAKIEPYKFND